MLLGLYLHTTFLGFQTRWVLVIPDPCHIDVSEKVRAASTQHVGDNGGRHVLFPWCDRVIDRGNEVVQGRRHDWACCLWVCGNQAATCHGVHALLLRAVLWVVRT